MKILLVDDHPLTVDAYETIIHGSPFFEKAHITKAYNCYEAYEKIAEARLNRDNFDLALIDYSLPPYPGKGILTGADIISLINKTFTQCRTLMITAHTEILLIYDLLRKANPSGLAIKSDIKADSLPSLLQTVQQGNPYKSDAVRKIIEEVWKKKLICEDYNRQILFCLAKGYRIKELEQSISLTGSAIQKRLSRLKKAFNAEDEKGLMKILYEQGFL